MARLYDMAQMTVSGTPGTGTITLGAAAVADGITYLTFTAAGAQTGDVVSYRIKDGSAWEVGRGTYTSAGTTLSRGLLKSSTGSLIAATSAAVVSIVALAEDFAEDGYATVAAAGTTQAGATALPSAVFCEVATGSGGVALPTGAIGLKRKIRNSLATAISIYPANDGNNATINTQASNAPTSVLPNTTGYFEAASTTKWFTVP